MADCRVKQATVSTATRYGIKPRIQGCPRGGVRMGGQKIRYHKKKSLISVWCNDITIAHSSNFKFPCPGSEICEFRGCTKRRWFMEPAGSHTSVALELWAYLKCFHTSIFRLKFSFRFWFIYYFCDPLKLMQLLQSSWIGLVISDWSVVLS